MFLSQIEPASAVPATQETIVAASVYQMLVQECDADSDADFDRHVVACIFALAIGESLAGQQSLSVTTGLGAAELALSIDHFFPHAAHLLPLETDATVEHSADEACLLDLLTQCASDGTPLQVRLAAMIARRAQSANHLWQDLGLRHRGDLSRLMKRHFRPLALRNSGDMKWKKFLYRMICRDAGYSLCTAPSCSECCDFEQCFGDESGESRLARVRLAGDLGAG
jgi:nitrogen fixation protein NifQ